VDRGVEGEELRAHQVPPVGRLVRKTSELREWLETIIFALVLALALRSFAVQVYKVEGSSMLPSFHTDERVIVNKFIYHLREPKPGEVVVLDDPINPSRQLIKRVIAVPGETIEIKQDQVYINGKPLAEDYINRELLRGESYPATVVPPGRVFVMGDNRGASFDSRRMGPIPIQNLEGKAILRFWPLTVFGTAPFDLGRHFQAGS
jgi:signal peptidase I